jgi:hypothetical protein
VIDRVLAEAGGEQLLTACNPFLSVEDELSGTLPAHIAGSVPFNLLRLYARG